MDKTYIIEQTKVFVKERLQHDASGHDWFHIVRVHKNALEIVQGEDVDLFVVELAALLHDVADWKFCEGNDDVGPCIARDFLKQYAVDEAVIAHVCSIMKNLSYKGQGTKSLMATKEGQIVQDADRLDALGAIGIARTFAYGGAKGQEMYNPQIKPAYFENFEQYKHNKGTSLNHFYEKLLLLKDLMNTQKAKEIAEHRHAVMVAFLDEFFEETGMQNFERNAQ